jgi:hypothetical protein
MDESGRPSFNRLQNFSANADAITFFAFDLLVWKGENLQKQPLEKRLTLLRGRAMSKMPAARFSESFQVPADQMVAAVRSQGLEGIVAKRRTSSYESGRRLGKDAHWRRPRICNWRVYAELKEFRRTARGLLRCRHADVCRQSAERIRTRHARHGLPSLQKAAYQNLPLREFAREQERPLG